MKKSVRKIVCGVLCIVMLASVAAAAAACSGKGYDKTIVYLGDSIAEGILGPSPFSERDSYCYYAIVGRVNNYRYVNCSVSGDTTVWMYNRLVGDSTRDKIRRYWISEADIIHISILGNDLLGGDIGQTAYEAAREEYDNIDRMIDRATQYFTLCIEKVKELNPDAVLMVNTVYNPLDAATTLLTPARKQRLLDALNGDASRIRTVGTYLLNRLNSVIYDYLDKHPDAFEVIDAYTAFDNKYKENCDEGVALIYDDWLHPSNEGHAVMASLIQDKLISLGLARKRPALRQYKKIRNEQLERLFADTEVDVKAASKAVRRAKSFTDVSEAYFKAVRGITPIYAGKEVTPKKGEIFKEDTVFKLESIKLDGKELNIASLIGGGDGGDSSLFDKEQSGFYFNADGTFSLKLVPDKSTLFLANVGLAAIIGNGLDISGALGKGGNFDTGIEVYINNLFPGFDLSDLPKIVELVKSVGININLDFENKYIKALTDSLAANLIIPKGFMIPQDFSVELKGYYYIERNGNFTNIYMGVNNVAEDGYPFLFATLHTDGNGTQWVETAIEVSKIVVTGR